MCQLSRGLLRIFSRGNLKETGGSPLLLLNTTLDGKSGFKLEKGAESKKGAPAYPGLDLLLYCSHLVPDYKVIILIDPTTSYPSQGTLNPGHLGLELL